MSAILAIRRALAIMYEAGLTQPKIMYVEDDTFEKICIDFGERARSGATPGFKYEMVEIDGVMIMPEQQWNLFVEDAFKYRALQK